MAFSEHVDSELAQTWPWRVRWLGRRWVVIVPSCILIWLIHAGISINRPSLWQSHLSLRPHPDAFLFEAGDLVVIRKGGSIAEIELSAVENNVCGYVARYWVQESAAAGQAPDSESSGLLSERMPATTITIGPWAFEWSLGDATRHWVYRRNSSFDVQIEQQ